ncbi:MAG: hypothetical protein QGF67_13335 [Lentisphaeria bacterium]|jgi:glucosamine-6-phosphate deaminase|nr:hypothetical protein [Lentisphaeria bacterium]MDP7742419.1 hypothetical protein [Lentisphaeria bacterium]
MIETNIPEATKKLQAIVDKNQQKAGRSKSYIGHPAEYSGTVQAVRDRVRTKPPTPRDLLKRKKHWHTDFGVEIVDSLEMHNSTMAINIFNRLAEHTSAGRPVIWITPVGPMGQYPIIAQLINKLGTVDTSLIHTFAMDEWATQDGEMIAKKDYPYMTTFRQDMAEQFFDLLDADHQIPIKNRNFAAGKHLHSYEKKVDRLMNKGAGVIFTGGVGKIGHIMFWESTFGVRLSRSLAEQVLWVRGAPLTFGTIDQNETTSSASAPVPVFANTIGLGLFVKLRNYGRKHRGRVHAYFGLDNIEEPLKWQRFIAQCMLMMETADPSFGASYVPTMPGAYIIVRSHVHDSFFVASK